MLTDEPYFQGSPEYLKQARAAVALPVLRKDFIIDEYQIYQRARGVADAILLIAAALEAEQLERFEAVAHELGMTVLLNCTMRPSWKMPQHDHAVVGRQQPQPAYV